jgi:Zn-finger nucleic acid-binding protein
VPYLYCPSCGLTMNGRYAYTIDACPKCLGRKGKRVALEAHLGTPQRHGRLMEAVRDEMTAQRSATSMSRDAARKRARPPSVSGS